MSIVNPTSIEIVLSVGYLHKVRSLEFSPQAFNELVCSERIEVLADCNAENFKPIDPKAKMHNIDNAGRRVSHRLNIHSLRCSLREVSHHGCRSWQQYGPFFDLVRRVQRFSEIISLYFSATWILSESETPRQRSLLG